MKRLKSKDIRLSYEPIYTIVTNRRRNWLSGHGCSCGIIWGTLNIKRHSFGGINGFLNQNELNERA